jgi:hypothetical protein
MKHLSKRQKQDTALLVADLADCMKSARRGIFLPSRGGDWDHGVSNEWYEEMRSVMRRPIVDGFSFGPIDVHRIHAINRLVS